MSCYEFNCRLFLLRCTLATSLVMPVSCLAQQHKDFPLNYRIVSKQPDVYWHDTDLNLDINNSGKTMSIIISRSDGSVARVALPPEVEQVDAIHRASRNRAVLLTEIGSGVREVVILKLNPSEIVDKFWCSGPASLSPDNRYVIFVRFYPAHGGQGYDDQYRLYDVLGTRVSNWPDRPANDAPANMPANYDGTLAGVPVYPLKAGELGRPNTNVADGQEHLRASSFVWSSDSSRVVFVDVQNSLISLVIVIMPRAGRARPETLVHHVSGKQNVCANADECDYKNVRSLTWDGPAVDVLLLVRREIKKDVEESVAVPLSEFTPAPR